MDAKTDIAPDDRSALLMMLAYVEAECRRLGADAAAEAAAIAAALVPAGEARSPVPAPRAGTALH